LEQWKWGEPTHTEMMNDSAMWTRCYLHVSGKLQTSADILISCVLLVCFDAVVAEISRQQFKCTVAACATKDTINPSLSRYCPEFEIALAFAACRAYINIANDDVFLFRLKQLGLACDDDDVIQFR